ncbi:MAG: 4Fe-4S binding protein [Elusimicrobiota bacterium]
MAKVKRKIIKIDEDKCNGCGVCIPSCPEGALKVVDTPKGPKARVVKENFCDGLGACVGDCPKDALHVVEATVDRYDEEGVIKHIKKTAPEKLEQHMKHLAAHAKPLACGCPGTASQSWGNDSKNNNDTCGCNDEDEDSVQGGKQKSQLRNWPVQLMLVNPGADYFKNAEIVFAADCVPAANPNFHTEFVKGKMLIICCPKLDDTKIYAEKLVELFITAKPKSVSVAHMEVPCCFGLTQLVKDAMKTAKLKVPYMETVIGIKGETLG